MEDNTRHFDSTLGGFHTVPDVCNLSDFLKVRMEEVVMLTETIKESPFRGQAFQRLPKHMRRRQMSHYIKRLPRRLQRPYILTLKDGLPAPTKCPSRKYRRKPANLLIEYNRRQKAFVWLETHIWHAKRFHMIKKWGYKLPEKPTNKSFRACYRAISEHCLVTDISYYNCIELKGSEEKLLKGLQQCTSTDCGLTFAAKMYLSGRKEGAVTLFHPNSYPNRVIGNVTFFWKAMDPYDIDRIIWIWVHPLTHNEIIECFKNVFNLKATSKICDEEPDKVINEEEKDETASELKPNKKKKNKNTKSKKRIEQIKLLPKNVPFSRTPKYANEDESVTMTLLKDTLNRFQLTGPLSQAIISQAFNLIQVDPLKSNTPSNVNDSNETTFMETKSAKRKRSTSNDSVANKKMKPNADSKVTDKKKWWEEYYKEETSYRNWKFQKDFYEKLGKCSKPTDVPSGLILPLVIGDPRLKIPKKREKAVSEVNDSYQIPENSYENGMFQSPIWNPEVRNQVSMTKLTTQEINNYRSKKIVPGFDVDDIIPDEIQSRIPILLVQRAGVIDCQSGRMGLGSGWDIISPAGYGMPIWQSLIFRGARSGGLRETELLQLECNKLNNYLQPDSAAGTADSEYKFRELRNRYFRLPPNKRPNYIKLGVPSPFHCPWNLLVREWIQSTYSDESKKSQNQEFRVLRSRLLLEELNQIIKKFPSRKFVCFDDLIKNIGKNCLIPVIIKCTNKGKPKDLALICLPEVQDLSSNIGPLEISHADENKDFRKILRSEHTKLLKSLRRKRRKDRSKLKENFANDLPVKMSWRDILKSNSAPSEEHTKEYKAKMESLWVPEEEKVKSIINYSSRKIIGFVVKGDFCFSKAISTAVGYVTIVGLIELLKIFKENKTKLKVLIRNNNQFQYRFGNLEILNE